MFKNITIGQYVPAKSPLHKADPRIKIILTVLFIILLFCAEGIGAFVAATLLVALSIFACKLPFSYIMRGIKPMLYIFLFTAVFNLFLTAGEPVWSFSLLGFKISITEEGITNSAVMLVRLLYLVVISSLLTLTTSPLELTYGIEKLLNPLRVFKVPAHEIAMMMSIALRFIPTLAEETDKIMKAQTARGADFESGNIVKRAKAMVPLLVPLFVSAFRRADDLATAMEARCYHGGEGRTKMKETKISSTDIKICAVFAVFAILILLFKFL